MCTMSFSQINIDKKSMLFIILYVIHNKALIYFSNTIINSTMIIIKLKLVIIE